jgi:ArsR family transcriptional regulator, arsenate/arsenite/antimonite-responsive transcriptional repressor
VRLVRLYDCLRDATRLRLLHLLAQGPLCVCHFEAVLRLPQARISRHLAYLRRHGLVTAARRGPWRVYALADPVPPALQANLACLRDTGPAEPGFARDLGRLAGIAGGSGCDCPTPAVPRRRLLRLAR